MNDSGKSINKFKVIEVISKFLGNIIFVSYSFGRRLCEF